MRSQTNKPLILAGLLNFSAAALHILAALGGPDYYRALGAGETLASMAEAGSLYPMFVALLIATVLVIWGLYAWSGARLIIRLPFVRIGLVLITAVYCIRGVYGFFVPVFSNHPHVVDLGATFWISSSAICLSIGVVHLMGIREAGRTSSRRLRSRF